MYNRSRTWTEEKGGEGGEEEQKWIMEREEERKRRGRGKKVEKVEGKTAVKPPSTSKNMVNLPPTCFVVRIYTRHYGKAAENIREI